MEEALKLTPKDKVDGFTPEQRFFIGFAQVWCENMSPQEARQRAITDLAFSGPLPRERHVAEHARIPEGLRLQARRPHGPPATPAASGERHALVDCPAYDML